MARDIDASHLVDSDQRRFHQRLSSILHLAAVALALAAIYLFRYSIDHGWLRPAVRAIMGTVTGVALLVVCELRMARRYKTTANAMDGAGVAILYSTFFACHSLWPLLVSRARPELRARLTMYGAQARTPVPPVTPQDVNRRATHLSVASNGWGVC